MGRRKSHQGSVRKVRNKQSLLSEAVNRLMGKSVPSWMQISHYMNVELSCDTFHKPKWPKSKKHLPCICMETFEAFPDPNRLL